MEKSAAVIIDNEIRVAIREIATKHGLMPRIKGTYNETGAKFSVELKETASVSASAPAITAVALSMCRTRGFNPTKPNASGYTLVDYNTRARRTPWIAVTPDGKRYRLSDSLAATLFTGPITGIVSATTKPHAAAVGSYEPLF